VRVEAVPVRRNDDAVVAPVLALRGGRLGSRLIVFVGRRVLLISLDSLLVGLAVGLLLCLRLPLLGRRRTREFTVEVRSLDAAGFTAALPARLTATPRLDWRVIPLALALAVALLPALLAARPVTPVILDFHAGSSALARGVTLELGWQVQDATALQLSLNGEPLEPPPDARQTRLSLDTAELAGEITLLLEARNGDRRVSQSVTVTIHEPLQVEAFSATPATLLRHVLQTLTLRWEVPGAQQVRIDGLAPATNREIAAGGARDGLAALPVLVDGALSLTLTAVDSYGNVLQQALTIPARPATCTVMSTTLGLRTAPRAAAPVLTQPAFGAGVEVDGRDPSGAWLRARTEGVSGWGRREGLRCTGFAPQDLRVLLPGRG